MKILRNVALGLPLALGGLALSSCSAPPEGPEGKGTSLSASVSASTKVSTESVHVGVPHVMRPRTGEPAEIEAEKERVRARQRKHSVTGPSTRVQYFGGPILSTVNIVGVDWTGSVNTEIQAAMPGFYAAVTGTGSPYFSWLTEYSTTCAFATGTCSPSVGLIGLEGPGTNQTLGFGTFSATGSGPGGMYVITPTTTTGTTLTDNGIAAELINQIIAGNLPDPTTAENMDSSGNTKMLFMIDFPFDYSVSLPMGSMTLESCSGFCAYHNTTTYKGVYVPYGVMPESCVPCGVKGTTAEASEDLHSHELVESVTDTGVGENVLGWYDEGSSTDMGGEVADLCTFMNAIVTFPGGDYMVQGIWSDQNDKCITTPPYCNGSNKPPSCVPCTSSTQCAAPTPSCETDTTSAVFGQCVACVSDSSCGALTCNRTTDTCQCSDNSECSDPTPICSPATGCVACSTDLECEGNAAGPACSAGSCVPCTKNSDCKAPTSECNTLTNTCYAPTDAGTDGSSSTPDAAAQPDSGPALKDSGSSDGQAGGTLTTTGGCGVAPGDAQGSGNTPMLLTLAGLVALGRRRRRHA